MEKRTFVPLGAVFMNSNVTLLVLALYNTSVVWSSVVVMYDNNNNFDVFLIKKEECQATPTRSVFCCKVIRWSASLNWLVSG